MGQNINAVKACEQMGFNTADGGNVSSPDLMLFTALTVSTVLVGACVR